VYRYRIDRRWGQFSACGRAWLVARMHECPAREPARSVHALSDAGGDRWMIQT